MIDLTSLYQAIFFQVVFKHTGFYPGDIIAAPFGTDFELVGVEVRQMWPSGDGGQESEA